MISMRCSNVTSPSWWALCTPPTPSGPSTRWRTCVQPLGPRAVTLIDGSQALPHLGIDVRAIGCDFYVATGHKAYGPTGIGFVWGRRELLEAMPPWREAGK